MTGLIFRVDDASDAAAEHVLRPYAPTMSCIILRIRTSLMSGDNARRKSWHITKR